MKRLIEPIRMWFARRMLQRGTRVIESLDDTMVAAGYNRTQRRQFWRDFIKKQTTRRPPT